MIWSSYYIDIIDNLKGVFFQTLIRVQESKKYQLIVLPIISRKLKLKKKLCFVTYQIYV